MELRTSTTDCKEGDQRKNLVRWSLGQLQQLHGKGIKGKTELDGVKDNNNRLQGKGIKEKTELAGVKDNNNRLQGIKGKN